MASTCRMPSVGMSAKRGAHAEGERGEQRELVRRVDAVDVGRGIRLRQPEPLRLGEHVVEAAPLARHRGEDVVAGAVDDAVHGRRPVARQRLLQRAQDRDAAADARLEAEPHAGALRGGDDLLAVYREQRLVRRHHVLAVPHGVQHEAPRRLVAAHQLDHHLDVRIRDQLERVARQPDARGRDAAIGVEVDVGDGGERDRAPRAARDLGAVRAEELHHAGADRAEADQPDAKGPSRRHPRQPAWARRAAWSRPAPSAFLMPRIACRVRCSFSISAKRT